MKFHYEYRTSDNVLHRNSVGAIDREAAFALLKAKGIRPCRLAEAPGLVNKLIGKGKRWTVILFLSIACALLVLKSSSSWSADRDELTPSAELIFDATARRQILGDAAVIENGIRTGWSAVFGQEGDRFLASFAIPGVPAGVRNTSEDEVRKSLDDAADASTSSVDSIETRQIRAIVRGMKDELRRYIKAGGTIKEYADCLVRRQNREIAYYNRAKCEIESAKESQSGAEVRRLWEQRNAELRRMGIRLVALPIDD